ncbi:protein ITPRID2 [Lucilia sericata]|uniref:protein ITPRID2 n=1 Tax=Lucilia sericata TaxID=13632 RepID=UPI0018A816B8|nr:protein ITPRID2 [Lucilia sericata]
MECTSQHSDFKENSSNSSCENILKIVEQQQIKTKTYQKHIAETTETQQRTSLMSLKTIQNIPQSLGTAQRKKRLQRQKSAVYSGDETEYAADLEEEDDDEIDEGYGPNERETNLNLPTVSNLSSQKKKQVRFRNKQQSESSLKLMSQHAPIEKTFSSSSLTSSLNSSASAGSHERRLKSDGSFDSIPELPHCSGLLQRQKCILKRDNSVHSDSSRYSSVDSLLEARKPDPEAILINLGFGPVGSEDILSRIPKRFLKPSQVRGIDTDAFIKRLQLANNLADHSVLGYRGLTGNPDIPPSHIVAKIMERFEVNERKKSLTSMELKLR